MSAPHIISSSWPSFCQKLSKLMEISRSSDKNNFDCFFLRHGVVAAFKLQRKRRHSQWVRPWILQRPVCGAYNKLFSNLLSTDKVSFQHFIRMDLAAFEDATSAMNQARFRQPISEKIRLEKYAQNEHVRSRRILRA